MITISLIPFRFSLRHQPAGSGCYSLQHSPEAAANEFIQRGIAEGKPLSHMEVQLLMYFAQGWTLAIKGYPLHDGQTEAARYGPIQPEVYRVLCKLKGRKADALIKAREEYFTQGEREIIEVVYTYRKLGEYLLLGISQTAQGPWRQTYDRQGEGAIIGKEAIREWFRRIQET